MFSAITLFLLSGSISYSYCGCNGTERSFECLARLKDDLLRNYRQDLLPVRNQSVPVKVYLEMFLLVIQRVDMKHQSLVTSGWLTIEWSDEFLRWDPEDYGNITDIHFHQYDIWLPDLLLGNSAVERKELGMKNVLINVKHTGEVHWRPGIITKTSCRVDITKYPFDTQECRVRYVSWIHTNGTVILLPETLGIGMEFMVKSAEWAVVYHRAFSDKIPASYRSDAVHTGVIYVIRLRRKRVFHILNTIIPVMLLSTLNVLVFILPPDCGERMGLTITVLLAFTVYLSIISENIPRNSEEYSFFTIYLTVLLALSTASVVCAALVLNLHFRDANLPVPEWVVFWMNKFGLKKSLYPRASDVSHATSSTGGTSSGRKSPVPSSKPLKQGERSDCITELW